MKLIKKLGKRVSKNGNYTVRLAKFYCSFCDTEVERPLSAGKRNKSCGCYFYTEEWKKKQAEALRGKKFSEEINKKKGRKGDKNGMYGKKHTEETIQKQSKIKNGKITSEETKQKQSKASMGVKKSEEHRKNISKAKKGEKHYNWNNGSSFEPYGIEFNKELKNYIKNRDMYMCQTPNCMNIENLHIHHIDYDKKHNTQENLITLCHSCHMKTNGKNNRVYWANYYFEIMDIYL